MTRLESLCNLFQNMNWEKNEKDEFHKGRWHYANRRCFVRVEARLRVGGLIK